MEIEDMIATPIIGDDKKFESDFEVTDRNYNSANTYGCENSHIGAKQSFLVDRAKYDTNTGEWAMSGVAVYVCPTCTKPVFEVKEDNLM